MEKLSRRAILRSLPAVAGLVAVPTIAAVVSIHDPLLDLIAERAAILKQMGEAGDELQDEDPLYDQYNETRSRLCEWGPASTKAGAVGALELAIADMDGGVSDLSAAMIRSAIGYLEATQQA